MADVLIVSPPLTPPWNDGSKNLARDLAQGMRRHRPVAFGSGWSLPRGRLEPPRSAPGLLGRMLTDRSADVFHFVFTPNPRSSFAAQLASRLRGRRSVQTVPSRPAADLARRHLFADRLVALSTATVADLRRRGVPDARLTRIPPAVPPLPVPTEEARRAARARFSLPLDAPLVVFPGDLAPGGGAEAVADAVLRAPHDALLVLACRPKQPGAAARAAALTARSVRIRSVGETPDIHALLGAADVVALPATDLHAKVDLPLVLLEAQWMARPVIVAAGTSAAELADDGGAVAVAGPEDLAARVATLLDDADARARLGANARAAAEQRRPEAMAAAYEAVYDELSP